MHFNIYLIIRPSNNFIIAAGNLMDICFYVNRFPRHLDSGAGLISFITGSYGGLPNKIA